MQRRLRWIAPAGLILAFSLGSAAQADALEDARDTCASGPAVAAETRVVACTQVLQAGKDAPKDLAGVAANRGGAYADLGDVAKAFADYNEAIRLDPRLAAAYFNRGLISLNREVY